MTIDPRPAPSRLRHLPFAGLTTALYGTTYLLWQLSGVGAQTTLGRLASTLAFLPLNLAVAALFTLAARKTVLDNGVRHALRFVAASAGCIALGNVIWAYYALARGEDPQLTIATVAYLAGYPLILVAIRSFPIATRERDERLKFIFDAATVAVSGVMVAWYVVRVSSDVAPDAGALRMAITLAYPAFDLVVLLGLSTLLLRRPRGGNRQAFTLFCIGQFLGMLADLTSTLDYAAVGNRSVPWTDALYVLSYVLQVWGAERYFRRPEAAPPPGSGDGTTEQLDRVQLVSPIPYLAVAAGLGLMLFVVLRHAGTPITQVAIGAIVLTVLVVARQVVAVRQNATLLAGRAAAESDRRYRLLFDHNPLPMYVSDAETLAFLEVNDAAVQHYGYSRSEFLTMTVLDLTVASREFATTRSSAHHPPHPLASLQRHRTKDGSIRDIEIFSHAIEFGRRPARLVLAEDVTERRQAADAAEESRSLLRATLESTADGIIVVDDEKKIGTWNQKLADMWEIPAGVLEAGDAETALNAVLARVREPAKFRSLVGRLNASPEEESRGVVDLADGRVFELYSQPQRLGNLVAGRIWSFRDVSERAAAEHALRGSEARFRSIFDHTAVGIALVDENNVIVETNRAFQTMLGYEPGELRGRPSRELSPLDDTVALPLPLQELQSGPSASATVETRLHHKRGHTIWVSVTISRVEANAGERLGVVCMASDITSRKELEAQLTHQAFHDALTNLANRALFRDRVERSLAHRDRRTDQAAVLYVDLDNFKTVNDSFGHANGDRLLVSVAGRLLNATRGSDTVARLGGDEFAILLDSVRDHQEATIVAQRVANAMQAPFELAGTSFSISASIGIACGPVADADELLRNADLAMYRAKVNGKGRHEMFHPEMHAAVVDKLELEAELMQAVERREFVLMYQPIVELDDGEVVGFEALVRWQHPRRGLLAPMTFIPLAEQTGVIIPLGRWVLNEACRQGALWQNSAPRDRPKMSMTVNISSWQLDHPTLVDDVRNALEASGLDPSSLVLEITEGAIIREFDEIVDRLRELKTLGLRIAIDDFGTGYSSLAYLQRFPIDILKIDKAFVDGVGRGGRDAALARTIIALGDMLSLHTVAEGIEQAEQRTQLCALGCGLGQGYLFAKPLSVADADALLDGSLPRPPKSERRRSVASSL